MDKRVAELNDAPRHLFGSWENKFIDSVYRQAKNGRVLSEKQINVLNRIYHKYQEWVIGDYDDSDPMLDAYEIFHD